MKKLLIAAIIALTVATLAPTRIAFAATGSNICKNDPCIRDEVGPFMQDISQECGNLGTCALEDIQIVFDNVATYILSIVGALVFLMYVVGGFYFLLSGLPGMEKYREKGKTALKTSTIGLIIVFGAYAIVFTLMNVLQGSNPANPVEYFACGPGNTNEGKDCAFNSKCSANGLCLSVCEIENVTTTDPATGVVEWQECFDTVDGTWGNGVDMTSCSSDRCPGPDTEQCCKFKYTPT